MGAFTSVNIKKINKKAIRSFVVFRIRILVARVLPLSFRTKEGRAASPFNPRARPDRFVQVLFGVFCKSSKSVAMLWNATLSSFVEFDRSGGDNTSIRSQLCFVSEILWKDGDVLVMWIITNWHRETIRTILFADKLVLCQPWCVRQRSRTSSFLPHV